MGRAARGRSPGRDAAGRRRGRRTREGGGARPRPGDLPVPEGTHPGRGVVRPADDRAAPRTEGGPGAVVSRLGGDGRRARVGRDGAAGGRGDGCGPDLGITHLPDAGLTAAQERPLQRRGYRGCARTGPRGGGQGRGSGVLTGATRLSPARRHGGTASPGSPSGPLLQLGRPDRARLASGQGGRRVTRGPDTGAGAACRSLRRAPVPHRRRASNRAGHRDAPPPRSSGGRDRRRRDLGGTPACTARGVSTAQAGGPPTSSNGHCRNTGVPS